MGGAASGLDDYLDWQNRFENYKASGLEADVFCLQEGVSRSAFYRWVDRFKDGIPESMVAEKAARKRARAIAFQFGTTPPKVLASFQTSNYRDCQVAFDCENGHPKN